MVSNIFFNQAKLRISLTGFINPVVMYCKDFYSAKCYRFIFFITKLKIFLFTIAALIGTQFLIIGKGGIERNPTRRAHYVSNVGISSLILRCSAPHLKANCKTCYKYNGALHLNQGAERRNIFYQIVLLGFFSRP